MAGCWWMFGGTRRSRRRAQRRQDATFSWRLSLGGFLLGGHMNRQVSRQTGWSWWYLLLIIQFVAVLWPPFYNKADPTWIGMPYFYWYQLLWIIIGAILTAIVYFVTED